MAAVDDTTSSALAERKAKPVLPDEATYKTNLAKAEGELAAFQKQMEEVKAKIDLAKPNNQDSPVAKRQQELRAELSSIRQEQQGFKASRNTIQEKINVLDATVKARIAEQKTARGRVAFKSVDEIDREISRLEKQVDSGSMKLVDERKALTEVSNLRKQRKGFSGFEETQKAIDGLKTQMTQLKKSLDDPQQRALSDRYTAIQKELDSIKADQDDAYKNFNSLRDQRSKIYTEQQKAYTALKGLKDDYYKARKAYREYEEEAFRIRRDRQKAEREIYEREKRKKIADKKLEEASRPAFTDEILISQGLIRHFDPTYDFSTLGLDNNNKNAQAGTYRAEVGRTVDGTGLKGMKVLKKEDRGDDYFVGGGGKKGKKGKKGAAAASPPETGKFNLNFGVIEDLSKVKVDPPATQTEVPGVIEKLAEKITNWKSQQATKTSENIKKAQEEIEKLEAEEAKASDKPAAANGTPAEAKQENGAVAEATEELKKASIEA
ncbi:hypothetical protein AJ80_07604 [Polytolypa hystricis UAMH7299]|uniref:Nuclear segregation protein Bfr1 n=1 Tax=Polytolypa hystricis (strain UAMH7299) TaxID=1447883 RepID=A0A2B7XE08_POLH7|nr:hypothetical protein AJ80_07604 [Polytolypa hystricis UAMH7299]